VHATDSACGAPRITAELNDGAGEQERVNHKRVARVMRERHIAGIRLRRRVRTTVPDPDGQLVPDLLERDFTAHAPNMKYVGDITYLPCGAGQFLYLATVIDCYSRGLVGWSIAEHMRTDLVADALRAAARERGSLAGAIFHSDHGGQYTSVAVSERLAADGIRPSMGVVGSSYDNALAETINGLYKTELIKARGPWRTIDQVEVATAEWVDWFNHRRIYEYCGDLPPADLEAAYYARNETPAPAAVSN
jgi:transposase InsO family protein